MINIDDRLIDELSMQEHWLLIHIVKRLGVDGTCWPSNATLLNDTKWKDARTLNAVKKRLVKKGIIKQEKRYKKSGEQTSNTYRVLTGLIGVYKPANKLQTGGTLNAVPGVHSMQGRGVHEMQGAGVHEMHPEVLSNEVLSNEVLSNEVLSTKFEKFWNLYSKKVERKKCEAKFRRLKSSEIDSILIHVPTYVKSTPDERYRKNPLTYLNGECWNDAIITPREKPNYLKVATGEEYKRKAREAAILTNTKVYSM